MKQLISACCLPSAWCLCVYRIGTKALEGDRDQGIEGGVDGWVGGKGTLGLCGGITWDQWVGWEVRRIKWRRIYG